MSVITFLAESLPPLVDQGGTATSVGVWILMAIMAGGAALLIYNQVLAAQVNRKVLKSPIATAAINPQPFIVAMEKEFVLRRDYLPQVEDLKNQDKENRKYSHDGLHDLRNELNAIKLGAEQRDQLLHKLDERTLNHTRVIEGINQKMDRIVDRVADKVEALLSTDRKTR